jgi:hypothetical protein
VVSVTRRPPPQDIDSIEQQAHYQHVVQVVNMGNTLGVVRRVQQFDVMSLADPFRSHVHESMLRMYMNYPHRRALADFSLLSAGWVRSSGPGLRSLEFLRGRDRKLPRGIQSVKCRAHHLGIRQLCQLPTFGKLAAIRVLCRDWRIGGCLWHFDRDCSNQSTVQVAAGWFGNVDLVWGRSVRLQRLRRRDVCLEQQPAQSWDFQRR